MKRIFLDDISDDITITGNDAQHLAYSMRAKKGDIITAVDRKGNTATIELVDFDKDTIHARPVGKAKKVDSEKTRKKTISLAECLPKQNKFDVIVEKATELGVDKIQPLISDRTIARPGNFRAKSKLERWERIAKAAAEQSERDTIPQIGAISELADWLREIAPTLGHFKSGKKSTKTFDGQGALLIFCYEQEREVPLQKILREYKNSTCDKDMIILIGPEGGFTDREVKSIAECGGVRVSLGERILKTDTAALSAIAAVQYEFS